MRLIVFAFCGLAFPAFLIGQLRAQQSFHPQIPKAWNDAEVAGYELPLSYGKPAQYMSAAEHYNIRPAPSIEAILFIGPIGSRLAI